MKDFIYELFSVSNRESRGNLVALIIVSAVIAHYTYEKLTYSEPDFSLFQIVPAPLDSSYLVNLPSAVEEEKSITFPINPNSANYDEFIALGLSPKQRQDIA